MAVVGLQLNTAEYSVVDNTYSLNFQFSNPDTLDSGYEVVARLQDNSEVILDRFVDVSNLDVFEVPGNIARTSSGFIFIDTVFPATLLPFGNFTRLFLRVYRSDNSYTYDSNTLRFRTPVSQPTNFKVRHDSLDLILSWDQKLTETVESFIVERSQSEIVRSFEIQDQLYLGINFTSDEFVLGEDYVVYDMYNEYIWKPVRCVQNGRLSITAETLQNTILFVDYQRTSTINYSIYKFTDPYVEYATVDGQFFNGSLRIRYPGDDTFYKYRVKGIGGDIEIYSEVEYTKAIEVTSKLPKLYPTYEASDIDYGGAVYFTMRNCLVDENVYKKHQFSLPLKDADDASYNFRGFIGVVDCPVEVYMDDVMFTVVRSDSNGEFSVNFNPPKSSFNMSVVAYNRDQTRTFVPIRDIPFDKVTIYSYFAMISRQIQVLSDVGYTLNVARHMLSLADETTIKEWYGRSLGLSFNYDDVYEKFRQEVLFLHPLLWNNPGLMGPSIMEEILEYYRINDYGIRSFSIHPGGDPFQTGNDLLRLGSSVVTSLRTQLGKNQYTYYVTSVDPSISTMESAPQTISVDYRVFNSTATINYPAIAIVWDPVRPKGQAKYNVYRQINGGAIKLIKTTEATGYIDNGFALETDRVFPTFQYANISAVPNLRFFSRTTLQSMSYGDYARNFLMVVIYGTAPDSIPFGIQDRLTYLLRSKLDPATLLSIKFI